MATGRKLYTTWKEATSSAYCSGTAPADQPGLSTMTHGPVHTSSSSCSMSATCSDGERGCVCVRLAFVGH